MDFDLDGDTIVSTTPLPPATTTTRIVHECSRVVLIISCKTCGRSARAHFAEARVECAACGERERLEVAPRG